ncbi:MAG TPA: radical SAM protein [Bacteriovoracaceae bacterium]|nr:radical SAM protein [Bacteriovoracaceae bacterium]
MTQVSSLYLHVPFCRHLCNYCDFYKKRFDAPDSQIEEFHQFLQLSLKRHNELMQEQGMSWAPLETVYLGGGTPSLWGLPGAGFFKQMGLDIKTGAEFTMEVDPGTWSVEMLKAWQDLGMNRISIGTQTLDPHFLKIMDRVHSLEESYALLSHCQQNDMNFSLDFLLGLPFSREKSRNIEAELDMLLAFKPKHISLYILNARSKYPHAASLPDDEFIRQEYLLVSEKLRSNGFHHYEVSNFALPGFESQHNMKYWRSESVAALGPTGTGLLVKDTHEAIRYKWKVTRPEVELESLGVQELELEATYLALRTSEGWKPTEVSKNLLNLFEQWNSLNYGKWDGRRIKLNSVGFVMLDSLMDDLFRISAKG